MTKRNIDYLVRDYDGFKEMGIKHLQENIPSYTDTSSSDAGIALLEVQAMGFDIISFYLDNIANETFLNSLTRRESALKWCRIFGYVPKESVSAVLEQVFVLKEVQDTDFTIKAGTQVRTLEEEVESSIVFETITDLVIPSGKLGDEKDENGDYLFSVQVEQGETVPHEFLGVSDGTKDQTFVLSYAPALINEDLQIFVDEGEGEVEWERVDNFIDSEFDSKHYKAITDEQGATLIIFGDGLSGKIPALFEEGITATYRVGGGDIGNVIPYSIKVIDNDFETPEIKRTFNTEHIIILGEDREDLDSIKENLPNHFRTSWGALNISDYESLVKENFTDVLQVKSYINDVDTDLIDLYILVNKESDLTEVSQEIVDFFGINKGGRGFITSSGTDIYGATEKTINLEVSLVLNDRTSILEIKEVVKEYLLDYFEFGEIPLNTEIFFSTLEKGLLEDNPENFHSIKSVRISDGSTNSSINLSKGEYPHLEADNISFSILGGV